MYKKISFILTVVCMFTVIGAFGSSNSLMPPPVSVINWHKDMRVLNASGIYISMEPTDDQYYSPSIVGGGIVGDMNVAFSDRFGGNVNFSIMGMSGKSEDQNSTNIMDFFMFSYNPNIIFEIIGGEKKDIAGEIIEDGFSMALFGGFGQSIMVMGSSQQSIRSGRKEVADSMSIIMGSVDCGIILEIPLSSQISLTPSYSMTKFISISVDGEPVEDFESPMQTIFGTDILVRPFKLNPNLKVSLGMLMGLVDANTSSDSGYKTTLILLGIQYEWGKHYSSVMFGPGIAK